MDLPINYDDSDVRTRRRAREQYVVDQIDKCWYCDASLSAEPAARIMASSLDMNRFPDGFLSWPIHLHHNHLTGMTIGAVHARCNAWLWQHRGE